MSPRRRDHAVRFAARALHRHGAMIRRAGAERLALGMVDTMDAAPRARRLLDAMRACRRVREFPSGVLIVMGGESATRSLCSPPLREGVRVGVTCTAACRYPPPEPSPHPPSPEGWLRRTRVGRESHRRRGNSVAIAETQPALGLHRHHRCRRMGHGAATVAARAGRAAALCARHAAHAAHIKKALRNRVRPASARQGHRCHKRRCASLPRRLS